MSAKPAESKEQIGSNERLALIEGIILKNGPGNVNQPYYSLPDKNAIIGIDESSENEPYYIDVEFPYPSGKNIFAITFEIDRKTGEILKRGTTLFADEEIVEKQVNIEEETRKRIKELPEKEQKKENFFHKVAPELSRVATLDKLRQFHDVDPPAEMNIDAAAINEEYLDKILKEWASS